MSKLINMNLFKTKLIIFLLLFINYGFTNNKKSSNKIKNAVYFEFAGQCPYISLNYDRQIIYNFTFKIGVGIMPIYLSSLLGVPIGFNYLIGQEHMLDLGLAITTYYNMNTLDEFDLQKRFVAPNICIGYRYQPKKGLFFKLSISSWFSEREINFLPGIGIGTAF